MRIIVAAPALVLAALVAVAPPASTSCLAFQIGGSSPASSRQRHALASTATATHNGRIAPLAASTLDQTDAETETPDAATPTTQSQQPKKNSNASTAKSSSTSTSSWSEQITNSGMASAAVMATAAVNAAVSMKSLEAPDVSGGKSYVALTQDGDDSNSSKNTIDEDGLPLRYDKDLIQQYWSKERGALNRRWQTFVGKAVPFLTKMITLFIRDGKIVDAEIPALSKQAREDLQDLGPTFIKLGQMMSVRPDVLPAATLDELATLQDSVVPFDTETAITQIETELGGPLGQFFSSISDEPVAAASLAQVYLATLATTGERVAIKVQRPAVLSTVSQDLYVLRRAAEVFQGLVERFVPQQKTNYVALLNEWAIGFYTELDFANEAANQNKLRAQLLANNITDVVVPRVYDELTTRRILVSEWVDGVKLSDCTTAEIAEVTPAAQEAFLVQLFETGFFHADPHPGNLLLLREPTPEGARLALIDCGLMAQIDETDRDNMISAVIHLANKNYAALVDDFIKLKILPTDTNRAAVVPLMDKALSPYVKGGGAKKYEEELRKLYGMEDRANMQNQVGGFQAMTQDALTVMNDIPFSIPPYFAILGRAIVTLEGVALTGNPDYGIILESYPFIARKLVYASGDKPEIQKALQEVLYSSSSSDSGGFKLNRLLALLNNAAGAVSMKEGAAFVDLDTIPEDGIGLSQLIKFVLSDSAESLRGLLEKEMDNIVDVVSRQVLRRAISEATVALTPPRPPAIPFLGNVLPQPPNIDQLQLPILLPGISSDGASLAAPSLKLLTIQDFTDTAAPSLNQDEEIYAISLSEAAREFFGDQVADLIKGERVLSAETVQLVLSAFRSGLLGRSDLLSSEAANNAIQFVGDALDRLREQTGGNARPLASSNLEEELSNAVGNLSEVERARLDEIVNELAQRAIRRIVDRLSVA